MTKHDELEMSEVNMSKQMKRYDQWIDHENDWVFGEKTDGEYVKYDHVLPLIEALKFYASGDYWSHAQPGSTTYSVVDEEDLGDGSFQLNEHTDDDKVGGKKAREALSTFGMGE